MPIIPEQFTVKAHPALFEGEGEGRGGGGGGGGEGRGRGRGEGRGRGGGMSKKLRNTFQRLRPEEFSSGDFDLRSFRQPGDFGLRSFCQLAISTWAEISAFSREGRGGVGKGEGRGVNGFEYCLVKVKCIDHFVALVLYAIPKYYF